MKNAAEYAERQRAHKNIKLPGTYEHYLKIRLKKGALFASYLIESNLPSAVSAPFPLL